MMAWGEEKGVTEDVFEDAPPSFDVGKGEWYHVGFHISVAVAGPALLSIPYAMSLMGWAGGLVVLLLGFGTALYCNFLVASLHDWNGTRHVRYHDLVESILGPTMAHVMRPLQGLYLVGSSISVFIQSGLSLQTIYQMFFPGSEAVKLWAWIALVCVLVLLLSQVPTIHSLRYINATAMVATYAYTFGSMAVAIYQVVTYPNCGATEAPPGCIPNRYYGFDHETVSERTWEFLKGMAILLFVYGNTVIPEIQSTAKHPAVPTMYRALGVLYTLLALTYIPLAVVGYWAYGYSLNMSEDSNLPSFMAVIGGPLWALVLINLVTVTSSVCGVQLCNVPMLEMWESWMYKHVKGEGYWSWRPWLLRSLVRVLYNASMALIAAAFPYLGDFLALLGALTIIPVDFVVPIIMYLTVKKPRAAIYWANVVLVIVFTLAGIAGVAASLHAIIGDVSDEQLFSNLGVIEESSNRQSTS